MDKEIEKKEKDWLEKIIRTLIINNYYKKFITVNKHKIYINNIYEYLKKDLGIVWLKKAPFISKAKKIYAILNSKYNYYKHNKNLQKIQKQYPTLQITEAFFYLTLKNKFKLKEEDLETFQEVLEIIFAKLKQK